MLRPRRGTRQDGEAFEALGYAAFVAHLQPECETLSIQAASRCIVTQRMTNIRQVAERDRDIPGIAGLAHGGDTLLVEGARRDQIPFVVGQPRELVQGSPFPGTV